MEFEQLRQLDAVARTGTFSAAAEELHTSQSSVSRAMQALERELGCELFTRARNRVDLNDAGRLALDHARAILAEERRMRNAFDELARTRSAVHVVSVAPAPVWDLTSHVVERFPGTVLTTETVGDEREVERRLFDRSADLVITHRPVGLPNVTCLPLMVENLYAYLPPTDELAGRASTSFAELDGRTFLLSSNIGFWGAAVRRAMPNARFVEQTDPTVFSELVRTTDLSSFVTDAAQFAPPDAGEARVRIPLRDADAHATFYLAAMVDAPKAVQNLLAAFRR